MANFKNSESNRYREVQSISICGIYRSDEMLEITEEQLLSFDNVNRARILKYIVLGLIKYIPDRNTKQLGE